jgi:hypothetical protein
MRLRLLATSTALGILCLATMRCGSKGTGFDNEGGMDDSGNPFGDDSGLNGGNETGPDSGVVVDKCHVPPDNSSGNAPNCMKPPQPPNSFNPVIKWKWDDPDQGSIGVWTIPLVANMTDDDGNGEVNLCDIPDVVIETAGSGEFSRSGKLYMLSGKDGKVESNFGGIVVDGDANPALADLDGDKIPEVIAVDKAGHIVILGNKGQIKFTGDIAAASTDFYASCGTISVYDLDADGTPEIIYAFEVFDNHGKSKWKVPMQGPGFWCPATPAADLDGDGKLEVIFGNSAYHYNGTMYWSIGGVPGQSQVANLDGNPATPEIFTSRQDGMMLVSHDGKILYGPTQLFDPGVNPNCWDKAAAIHDFDGDGIADVSQSSCAHYGVFHPKATMWQLVWSNPVDDGSGVASSTAFDFLGRGIADAVYGDQSSLFVWDGKTGTQELKQARSSGTIIEYPIVADVDNDGSADILVVSNGFNKMYPALQVFQDSGKRWIPTRRIWNQHAYHVTNVREDGTIPAKMKNNWQLLNTFRTNAQIENGGDCAPPPPNPPK